VIWFTGGAQFEASANKAQLAATTNAAVLANVSLHPIDTEGGTAEGGRHTLESLAAATGGAVSTDEGRALDAMVRAQQSIRSHYIIGFLERNRQYDGKARQIEIECPGCGAASLDYRRAFIQLLQFVLRTDFEKRLQDALTYDAPFVDIPFAVEESSTPLPTGRGEAELTVRVPYEELL
jgi:hypothetical protein